MKVTAFVSLKVANIHHFKGKKPLPKLTFLRLFLKHKLRSAFFSLGFSHTFEIFLPCLIIFFDEVTANVSLNVATNGSLADRKPQKWAFWWYYFKAKMDECNQSNLCFMNNFEGLIPWTTIYFLEVCARVSPKVTTNGIFRAKQISKISIFEAIILKQNEGVQPK